MIDDDGTRGRGGPQWLRPETGANDLRRYAATLRERGWLIVIAVLLCTLTAIIYVKTASPVYNATAQVLVSPVSGTDAITLSGLGVITNSSDPTQDVETAATIFPSTEAARTVKQQLHLPGSPQSILGRVTVQPVSQSNILAVTAQAPNASEAAALANAFAQAALARRTAQFRTLAGQKIATLTPQVGKTSASSTGAATALQQELASLQGFVAGPLPDMSLSTPAVPPTGRTSPRAALSIGVAIVAGLVLGVLGAFALEAFDSTLRREEQLRRLFRLPVLARIPLERGSQRSAAPSWLPSQVKIPFERILRRSAPQPRLPESLSPAALEGYRTLRAMLLASRTAARPARSILVTSASPREGKTTTAINLAVSLASFGASTILIEADMRLPSVGNAIKLGAPYGLADVLLGRVDLDRALVSSPRYPDNLRFLLGKSDAQNGATSADALFLPTVLALLEEAQQKADHVVVDSPPLAAVIDALELAVGVDLVLLVARLGYTHVGRLATLGALLSRAQVTPAGIALIGAQTPGATQAEDYYHSMRAATRPATQEIPPRARARVSARLQQRP
jgi:non-specific protein-tyrosine kinase